MNKPLNSEGLKIKKESRSYACTPEWKAIHAENIDGINFEVIRCRRWGRKGNRLAGSQTVEGLCFARRRFHCGHKRFQLGQHLLWLVHVLLDDLHNRGAGDGTSRLRVNRCGDLIRG